MKHNCIIKYLLAISLHFLFFQRNTWAQIKLDELKKLENDAKLSDVAKTVSENYAFYHDCSLKNRAWGEWYKAQKKIFEDAK